MVEFSLFRKIQNRDLKSSLEKISPQNPLIGRNGLNNMVRNLSLIVIFKH
jgi:hypothetical protein